MILSFYGSATNWWPTWRWSRPRKLRPQELLRKLKGIRPRWVISRPKLGAYRRHLERSKYLLIWEQPWHWRKEEGRDEFCQREEASNGRGHLCLQIFGGIKRHQGGLHLGGLHQGIRSLLVEGCGEVFQVEAWVFVRRILQRRNQTFSKQSCYPGCYHRSYYVCPYYRRRDYTDRCYIEFLQSSCRGLRSLSIVPFFFYFSCIQTLLINKR